MTHLDFSFEKRRSQGFFGSIFENGKTHGRKFLFLTPFGQTFQQFLNFFMFIHVVLVKNFTGKFELCFYPGGAGHLNVT